MASGSVASYVAICCYSAFGVMLLLAVCSVVTKLWRETSPGNSHDAPGLWTLDALALHGISENGEGASGQYTRYREREPSQRLLHLASWRESVKEQSAKDLTMLQPKRLRTPSLDAAENKRASMSGTDLNRCSTQGTQPSEPLGVSRTSLHHTITIEEEIGATMVDDDSSSSDSGSPHSLDDHPSSFTV